MIMMNDLCNEWLRFTYFLFLNVTSPAAARTAIPINETEPVAGLEVLSVFLGAELSVSEVGFKALSVSRSEVSVLSSVGSDSNELSSSGSEELSSSESLSEDVSSAFSIV